MNNIKSKLKTRGLQQQIRWRKITEQDVLVIAANQFAGHGVARPSLFYNNYVGIRNESIYKRIKVLIKFVCKLPFTFYLYSLIQFFNFRTKIPLRPQKMAIAQTPTPPSLYGHWPFCVTKVGVDVVPYPKPIKGALTIILNLH